MLDYFQVSFLCIFFHFKFNMKHMFKKNPKTDSIRKNRDFICQGQEFDICNMWFSLLLMETGWVKCTTSGYIIKHTHRGPHSCTKLSVFDWIHRYLSTKILSNVTITILSPPWLLTTTNHLSKITNETGKFKITWKLYDFVILPTCYMEHCLCDSAARLGSWHFIYRTLM